MTNIFDYLTDVQYDSFYDLPLNELDILAFTELTYLPLITYWNSLSIV